MTAQGILITGGRRAGLALVLAALLSACVAQFRNHGYIPPEEDLAAITVGVDSRDSVAESLGSPIASGVQGDSAFYYVSTRIRHYGFSAPEIIDRQVVAISFNPRGVVSNVERFTLRDGKVVPLARRVTDSSVADTTFLRQLLGNLGRFDAGTLLSEG